MPNNDLISRSSVLKGFEEIQESAWYNYGKEPNRDFPFTHLAYTVRKETVEIVRDLCIKQEPTVDAEPVRHGRWAHHKGGYSDHYECTVCGEGIVLTARFRYCPNCGAKMEGDENADN